MKLDDEVRDRIGRLGGALPTPEPSLPDIARRGHARRVRRTTMVVLATLVISATLALPAFLLRDLSGQPARPGDGGAPPRPQASAQPGRYPTDENGQILPDAFVASVACANGAESIVEPDGRSPAAICRKIWASEHLAPQPQVTTCGNQGGVVVYAKEVGGTCAQLGLEEIPSGYRDVTRRFAAVREGLEERFADGLCWHAAELVRGVRQALDAHGFEHWIVEDRTHQGARCASASVIDPTRLSYQIVDEPLLGEG